MLFGTLIVLAVIIALLAIPISVIFSISRQHQFSSDLKLGWMFGLIQVRIPTQKSKLSFNKDKRKKVRQKKAKRNVGKKRKNSKMHLLLNKQFRQRIFKFAKDVWRSIKKENIELRIDAGLDDPAETGQLWALVGPISGYLKGIREYSINIQPNFVNPGFELEGKGNLRFSPLRIIGISIGLLLSPSIWRTLFK